MAHYLLNLKHLNICVLGENGIGKSSLIIQFVQSHYPDDYDPTLQDTYSRSVNWKNQLNNIENNNSTDDINESILLSEDSERNGEYSWILDILDTVGIEDYSELRELQIQEADAVIFCYDVTSKETYDIVTLLHQQVLRCREDNLPPMILCGTKSDLVDERQLSYQDGEILCKELNLNFFLETSAKLNVNVEKCFIKLAQEIVELRKNQSNNKIDQITNKDDEFLEVKDYNPESAIKSIHSQQEPLQKETSRSNSLYKKITKEFQNNDNNNNNNKSTTIKKSISNAQSRQINKLENSNELKNQNNDSRCCIIM